MTPDKKNDPIRDAYPGGLPEGAVAVIGMAGRFPGAASVEKFAEMLWTGGEGISRFKPEEADSRPMGGEIRQDPNFVGAGAVLDDVDMFDAAAFGLSAREAVLLDPQQRLFLECAAESLDDASLNPNKFEGRIGVFGGCGMSSYLLHVLIPDALLRQADPLEILMGSDKDFIATRVSYLLNLTGPSMTLQTACSTSLLAIHMAAQSILASECDAALAGGATVIVPQKLGYIHHPGGISSADGYCRPFDAKASGTVFGSGAGVVVLRRLEDALRDGDPVRAVLRASAVNNDGRDKVGFTAPSVSGQTAALAEALNLSGLKAAQIGYIEAHGTATPMGDPIEFTALREVYDSNVLTMPKCLLGSVKSNVGHLDAASGVTGFIKTVLCLELGSVPPTLHFNLPNTEIALKSSRFMVSSSVEQWAVPGLRRAAVSSFGVGGTNVHAILEQAASLATDTCEAHPQSKEATLLVISAASAQALSTTFERLAEDLEESPSGLANAAQTLWRGRKHSDFRRAVAVFPGTARAALKKTVKARKALTNPRAAFLLAGQGSQYPGMSRDLAEGFPVFRSVLEECIGAFKSISGLDLAYLLLEADITDQKVAEALRQTSVAQPAIFSQTLACAEQWRALGLEPSVLLGHSIGELSAAALSGVFSFEDAVRLVSKRAELMQNAPASGMLSVPLEQQALSDLLRQEPNIDLAVVNGLEICVLSGPRDDLARIASTVENSRWLKTSHGFHSRSMAQAAAEFTGFVAATRLSSPRIPIISNLTGKILDGKSAINPEYWGRLLREPVQFHAGLLGLVETADILVECGPGDGLTGLARLAAAEKGQHQLAVLPSCLSYKAASKNSPEENRRFFLNSVGGAWEAGADIAFVALPGASTKALKARLPATAFERKRYWPKTPAHLNFAEALGTKSQRNAGNGGQSDLETPSRLSTLERLRALWAEVLQLDDVAAYQSFVQLGGTSVIAMQLAARCRQDGLVFKTSDLMRLQTPHALAEFLETQIPLSGPAAKSTVRPAHMPEASVLSVMEGESGVLSLRASARCGTTQALEQAEKVTAQTRILRLTLKKTWRGIEAKDHDGYSGSNVYSGYIPELTPEHGFCGALSVFPDPYDESRCTLAVSLHMSAGSPGDAATILNVWTNCCNGKTEALSGLTSLGEHQHAPLSGYGNKNASHKGELSEAMLKAQGQAQLAAKWSAATNSDSGLFFSAIAVAAIAEPERTRVAFNSKRVFSLPPFSDKKNLDEVLLGMRLSSTACCEPREAGDGAVRLDWIGDLSIHSAQEAENMVAESAKIRTTLPSATVAVSYGLHHGSVLYAAASTNEKLPAGVIMSKINALMEVAGKNTPSPLYIIDPSRLTASYVPFEDLKVLFNLEDSNAI